MWHASSFVADNLCSSYLHDCPTSQTVLQNGKVRQPVATKTIRKFLWNSSVVMGRTAGACVHKWRVWRFLSTFLTFSLRNVFAICFVVFQSSLTVDIYICVCVCVGVCWQKIRLEWNAVVDFNLSYRFAFKSLTAFLSNCAQVQANQWKLLSLTGFSASTQSCSQANDDAFLGVAVSLLLAMNFHENQDYIPHPAAVDYSNKSDLLANSPSVFGGSCFAFCFLSSWRWWCGWKKLWSTFQAKDLTQPTFPNTATHILSSVVALSGIGVTLSTAGVVVWHIRRPTRFRSHLSNVHLCRRQTQPNWYENFEIEKLGF